MTNKNTISRRGFMKTTVAGLGALAAPAIISSKVLASSGELNFMGWAGYPDLKDKIVPAFTKATGIAVNFTEQPEQDSMFAQAKVALQSGGVDVTEPTVDRVSAWNSNGLIQAWDDTKLDLANYLPGLIDGNAEKLARIDGKLYFAPSNWGTEALVVKSDSAKLSTPPSLGDLFNKDNQVVVRPHSALASAGRYLEAQGKLPFPWLDGYSDMAKMTQLWDIALDFAIKAKGNVIQWWSGENDAHAGFADNGATLGQCWDSTGYNLRNDGYAYVAPVEGAYAWNQGFVLMKNAANVDQAHEFAKFVSGAEGSAGWATAFSANPVNKAGYDTMGPDVAKFYGDFLTEATSKALWWWPSQSAEFVAKRGEYADKYKAA